ncbi:hypothetical protein ASF70_15665 [Rhizobium sp. Leaf321]|uniref:FkbM family methyltransferase n=1 Tax=Rhizobium sp. Leaf321 TaxID=1736335 RepID=UPI000715BEB5|nr:FkbM family methyltransferase [Rhizobium sp. Leaf321]KQQ72908.1 hypothetical protein ASF70_15665 [Rhizobium sp. Leaf321]
MNEALSSLDNIEVIFDVGANVGNTVEEWRTAFPSAKIFAFEPISTTFRLLREKTQTMTGVRCFRVALSDTSGEGVMRAVPGGVYNRLLTDAEARPSHVQNVQITTGDTFCSEHRIRQIDFLKIDAEGNDLKVLYGFRNMLTERKIRYVQVETGVNLDNKTHVNLIEFLKFFHEMGYGLVELYEPIRRNPPKKMMQKGMYFANALFAAEELSEREQRIVERDARLAKRAVRAGAPTVEK